MKRSLRRALGPAPWSRWRSRPSRSTGVRRRQRDRHLRRPRTGGPATRPGSPSPTAPRQRRHLAHRVRPARRAPHQQLLGRRRHPHRQPLRRGQEELGRRRSPRAPRFSWGYIGTGAVPGAAQLHHQRRVLRRWRHPADHRRRRPPAADHAARPPPPPPTTPPPTTTAARPGGKKVVGYFAEWGVYGRNYHVKNIAHQRFGGQADPHPLRVRQHHRRPVLASATATPTTTRRTPRPTASTASPTPGTSRCAAASTSCASSSGCTRTSR